MDNLVKDLSFVGKTTSKINLIVSIIVSIILLILSYVFLTKKDDYIKTTSNIKKVKKCSENYSTSSNQRGTINTNKIYNCIITVDYTVNNKLYTNDIITNSKIDYLNYNIKTLDISYNPNNPDEIRLPKVSSKIVGFIFLAIAIIILGASYYSNYMTQNSTAVATTQGIDSLSSIIGLKKNKY